LNDGHFLRKLPSQCQVNSGKLEVLEMS